MSDDATKRSTADSTYHSASLSIRTCGAGGKATSHDEGENEFFHGMESDKIHLRLFTIFMKRTAKFLPLRPQASAWMIFKKSKISLARRICCGRTFGSPSRGD
jgi:hypothetical protein